MLHSTTTLTLCNCEKIGNMIGVIAGHNGCSAHRVGFSCSRTFGCVAHGPRLTSTCACTSTLGRTLAGSNGRIQCSRGRLGTFGGNASPCLCPGMG